MAVKIQIRRDTASNWNTYNPLLSDGEIAVAKDLQQIKIGNGLSTWSQLPYINAPATSPAFDGIPTAPTAAVDTNTTQIATTAFVVGQGYAKIASPSLTGTPVAPTASVNTNTTQIATTAFVVGQASSTTPLMNGTAAVGTSLRYAREDHVHAADTTKANLSGATFTGAVSLSGGATVLSPSAAGSNGVRNVTMSTSAPTGGNDGDMWLVYT